MAHPMSCKSEGAKNSNQIQLTPVVFLKSHLPGERDGTFPVESSTHHERHVYQARMEKA